MSRRYRPLPVAFFARRAQTVARELLGAYLISEADGVRCVGRIVETEAYPGPHDPASHAAQSIGRTPRNDPMYGSPGTAYIHRNFGVHWCLNAVVERKGYPAAVLIRAIEPVEGIEAMHRRRPGRGERELGSGPSKLTRALGIGPELQCHRLRELPLVIAAGAAVPARHRVCTTRVGIRKGSEKRWRFYDARSDCVSRKAPAHAPG